MLCQHVRQPVVIGAAGVPLAQAGRCRLSLRVTSPTCSALNLPVHRRMRRARQIRDLGQAQLTIRVAEQQRKNLALLLRPQDRQE